MARIMLEMLGVALSKDARARAIQLPAWNEALGLPRPWDQQWSLRMQQVLAYESDLLEYDDLFEGRWWSSAGWPSWSPRRVPRSSGCRRWGRGGRGRERIHEGRARGVACARRRRIESGEDVVVGVNAFQNSEPNPLLADLDAAVQVVDPDVERLAVEALQRWRAERDGDAVDEALTGVGGGGEDRRQPVPADAGVCAGRCHDRRVGRRAARGVRRVPGADRSGRSRGAGRVDGGAGAGAGGGRARPPRRSAAGGCGCWWASRGWTGTPTAPSRSRCAPATPASR